MGDWHIIIKGHGQHHNHAVPSRYRDVDLLIRKFVQELRDKGHRVDEAHLLVGTAEPLHIPHHSKVVGGED